MIRVHEEVFMLHQVGFSAKAIATAEKLIAQGYTTGTCQREKIILRRPLVLQPNREEGLFGVVSVKIDSQGRYQGIWTPIADDTDAET